MIRNVPHLALIPLVILWFGIDESAKIFLVALGTLFPIYLNTYHGIRGIDPGLLEMARSYGLSGFALFRQVILPGALPSILVGVRFALGLMWLTLIVAETISANSGIGYLAMNAREFLQTDVVVVGDPAVRRARQAGRRARQVARTRDAALAPRLSTGSQVMNASTLNPGHGPIAGADLDTELAQARISDGDRQAAAVLEHDAGAHVVPLARRREGAVAGASARSADHSIELRHVGKRYGERAVLSDFNLSIERGSFVAIVGRSGCGKSTLLRLLAGLEQPSDGALVTRGEAGEALDTRIMFQDARLLPWKTVLQNVMLGLGRGSREEARAVLDEVGLLERANEWPAQPVRRPAAARGPGARAGASGRACCCSTSRSARSMR